MKTATDSLAVHDRDLTARHALLLRDINQLNAIPWRNRPRRDILIRCGEILASHGNYTAVAVIRRSPRDGQFTTFCLTPGTGYPSRNHPIALRGELKKLVLHCQHEQAVKAISHLRPARRLMVDRVPIRYHACTAFPLIHQEHSHGVTLIFSTDMDGLDPGEFEFLQTAVADISLALYAHDVTHKLKAQRDFNTEIIDTIQALMISITPCGHITRFNPEAERVTGYRQEEVFNRYWVDVLLVPEQRLHYQKVLSYLLKSDSSQLSFRADLQTRAGRYRTIDWYASIKPEIEEGTVGMVLLGIDITERLEADRAYDTAVAKWENIFTTIQDPALIATTVGEILDANHATFTAARKNRDEVIGKSICEILHGGHSENAVCPLEGLLAAGKSRILHTHLTGLHGDYLLTLSPLRSGDTDDEAFLLVARDTTEEEQLKAESLRSSQLAAIGELAAGVAHEINNPINGILNYAQMIEDLVEDLHTREICGKIIDEGKRIAMIVRNLLDFSRRRLTEPEPHQLCALIDSCVDLVFHQLHRDHIVIERNPCYQLPLVYCNGAQIQQVLLNVISNSRYALNKKYPGPHPEKKIVMSTSSAPQTNKGFVRLSVTDFGIGLEHHEIERVFDPFFSTKPEGEGTGLGLSISYGLIRDNGGTIHITSERGRWATVTIELPIIEDEHDNAEQPRANQG